MTYSIVARDAETGQLGVAVQSHWFSVGAVVTWAEPGVGAVATQSFADPAYGPQGLALMRIGLDAATALAARLTVDAERERRQVAYVDAAGRVAAHTGDRCIAAAGHVTGDAVSTQANMMRSDTVWPAMLDAYGSARGDLADRLLAALDAAEAQGGDIRGRQSAAILIVSGASSGQPWLDRVVDLRVDDAQDPLGELRRLLTVHRGYKHMEAAEMHEIAGDVEGALHEYETARRLLDANDEAAFWSAVFMVNAGRVEEGRTIIDGIAEREPGWRELLRRLPAAGLLHDAQRTVEQLLGD